MASTTSIPLVFRTTTFKILIPLVLLAVSSYFFWPIPSSATSTLPTPHLDVSKWGLSSSSTWVYKFPRDANHHGLSAEQCDAAFPGFYGDIESAVESRKNNPVTLNEIKIHDDKCLVRVLIYDSEIFIIQGKTNKYCWIGQWHERTTGLLHSINRAVMSVPYGTIPNIEFVLDFDDDPQRPIDIMRGHGSNKSTVWGLTRRENQRHIWLIPDYAYWAWPSARVASHQQVRRKMADANAKFPWAKKISKVVWRGTTHLNPGIRWPLVKLAKEKEWGDVKVCDIYQPKTKQFCITQDQHCQYKFPVHTEGYTYSGRLKYLQLCNSAPVVHKLKWLEHHHGVMRPNGTNQNFIQVERNWTDLESKILYYQEHEEEAQRIAQNNYETFYERYLTPAATSCYWRKVFHGWSRVQGFEPQLYVKNETDGRMMLRGTSFEQYVVNATKAWPAA
ncbi:hypothetical protein AAFC00_004496 [Neodothiora populina]|uniref:Glycosyl transferase CAP10 domain-containing protein n=1 Tax=Neodothiora populina TaxID=2781224 RepID=A0ABR3P282_9PEZI